MTTIVFRDGIMAADTRAYSGASTPIGFKAKIHRLKDGSLMGVSSTIPGQAEAFINWVNDGSNMETIDQLGELKLAAIVAMKDGNIIYFNDSPLPSGPIAGSFFAIGSGEQYALGALSCGATAEAAVTAAAQHDPWTGGEIHTVPVVDPDVEAAVDIDPDLPPVEDIEAEDVPKPKKKRKPKV